MRDGRIYSIGYEGLTLRTFIEHLSGNRVSIVFDVRLNAVSRRPGFAKRSLEIALRQSGIEYRHRPALGNPRENRDSFAAPATRPKAWCAMRERLDAGGHEVLLELVDEAKTRRVAVMCVERSEVACHRSVIIEAVKAIDPTIDIIAIL